MKKYLTIIFTLLLISNFSYAKTNEISADIALDNILTTSIQSIANFKKNHKNATSKDIKQLVKSDLLPYIDSKLSTKKTLEKYWSKITDEQKIALENYIVNSLIKDYSNILLGFNDFDKIKLTVNPKIKTKGNKAIVRVNFSTTSTNDLVIIATKMINNNGIWKIYDVVFSGVSLMKNYKAKFDSYIKRKGFAKFSEKYLTTKK